MVGFISGSRDSQLGLWQINKSEDEPPTSPSSSLQVPEYSIKSPLLVKQCPDARKVRALSYHNDRRVGSHNIYYLFLDLNELQGGQWLSG